MFDADIDLQGEEVIVEQEVVADKETIDEITLAKALEALKTTKPKIRGIVIREHEEPKPMQSKKKDQILLDEEVATKLQNEINEEERLEGVKAQQELEVNITLIEKWDDDQAKIDADYQLAKRLQAKEQKELNDEEKGTSFM
nr:hypothetical protein [Tanacetum cinerariifolium]